MASQTPGIQQLLQAEKKAAEKIAKARAAKAKRLKQAKEEAVAEIEKFRNEQELRFREYEQKHMGSRDDIAVKIEKETSEKLAAMNKSVAQAKDKVIEDLLNRVIEGVQPQLHRNLRLANN